MSAQPPKPSFNFGGGQTVPSFDATQSTLSFRTPQQSFGGAPSTPSGGAFTFGTNSNSNPPRQMQKTRRRLRK